MNQDGGEGGGEEGGEDGPGPVALMTSLSVSDQVNAMSLRWLWIRFCLFTDLRSLWLLFKAFLIFTCFILLCLGYRVDLAASDVVLLFLLVLPSRRRCEGRW